MPKKDHTEERIVAVLRQVEARSAGGRDLPQGGNQPGNILFLEAAVFGCGSERAAGVATVA